MYSIQMSRLSETFSTIPWLFSETETRLRIYDLKERDGKLLTAVLTC